MAAASAPRLQHGASQGIRVDVYAPGTALFDLRHAGQTARRYPGRVVQVPSSRTRVGKDVIGFWVGQRTIVFTVTSSTGRRFFVVAKRGSYRLPVKNLGDLAFVF